MRASGSSPRTSLSTDSPSGSTSRCSKGSWPAGRRAERGLDCYRDDYTRYVKPRLGQMRLGEIEPRHLSDLIRAMRKDGFAESSIRNALMPLRGLYRLARSRGLAGRSPFDGLDPTEVPRAIPGGSARVLDENELAALVRHTIGGYGPASRFSPTLACGSQRFSAYAGRTSVSSRASFGSVRSCSRPARIVRPGSSR
jgi:hypothetical protein